MQRVLRSLKLREILFYSQDGKCAICGGPLGDGWHADHKIPWIVRPVTNVHEMQALCKRCGLRKGAKTMVERAEILRPFQHEFIRICGKMTPENNKIIAHVTPGGGKGSLPYLVALSAPREMVQGVLHIVPRLNLATQSETKPGWLHEYCAAMGIREPVLRKAINVAPEHRRQLRGDCDGYAICWDSIRARPQVHYDELRSVPYALIIDEPQLLPSDGTTKKALDVLCNLAKCLVIMSGTMERGNRKAVAYVPYKNTDKGQVVDYENPQYQVVEYSREEALRDHAILPILCIPYDCYAKLIKGDEEKEFKSFNELTDKQDRRDGLYAVLAHEGGLQIAQNMMTSWLERRKTYPGVQALIITHSQGAAREYKAKLKEQFPVVRIDIAISDEPESNDIIDKFRKGGGDVLITVGMAYIGFDAIRVSHIALLTYIRSRPWIEQALARGVRVDPDIPYGKQRCFVYAPNDPLLRDILTRIEKEQEAALLDEDSHEGPTPPVREPIHVLMSGIGVHANRQLNFAYFDPALTGVYDDIARKLDSPKSAMEVYEALFETEVLPYVPHAPEMGVSQQEAQLKTNIERRCRKNDLDRGREFGATSKEMFRAFGKSRQTMTLKELIKASAWLDQYLKIHEVAQ